MTAHAFDCARGALATLLLLAAVAGPAIAQDEADARFGQGVAAFSRGDYDAALREFQASRDLRETASVVLNIAGCLHALGRSAEALGAYRRFVELRGPHIRRPERRRVERATQELEGRVARITVRTNVAGAQVTVDGRPVGSEPIIVDPGTEVIAEARLEGHRPARASGRPAAPGPFQVLLTLEPLPATGSLTVTASAAPALVLLDGAPMGQAPWEGDVPVGTHALLVRAPGHLEATRSVEVRPGEEQRIALTLVPDATAAASAARDDVSARLPARRSDEPAAGGSALPWVLGGAGIVLAAGAGIAIWLLAREPLEGDALVEGP